VTIPASPYVLRSREWLVTAVLSVIVPLRRAASPMPRPAASALRRRECRPSLGELVDVGRARCFSQAFFAIQPCRNLPCPSLSTITPGVRAGRDPSPHPLPAPGQNRFRVAAEVISLMAPAFGLGIQVDSFRAHHTFLAAFVRRQVLEKRCGHNGSVEPSSVVRLARGEEPLLPAARSRASSDHERHVPTITGLRVGIKPY
jgi:hypothetical protein